MSNDDFPSRFVENHDTGDEHPGRNTIAGIVGWAFACPFCDGRIGYGNHCKTPIWERAQYFSFEPMKPDDFARVEVFDTCNKPECVAEANRFAEQHHKSDHLKQTEAFKRWRYAARA